METEARSVEAGEEMRRASQRQAAKKKERERMASKRAELKAAMCQLVEQATRIERLQQEVEDLENCVCLDRAPSEPCEPRGNLFCGSNGCLSVGAQVCSTCGIEVKGTTALHDVQSQCDNMNGAIAIEKKVVAPSSAKTLSSDQESAATPQKAALPLKRNESPMNVLATSEEDSKKRKGGQGEADVVNKLAASEEDSKKRKGGLGEEDVEEEDEHAKEQKRLKQLKVVPVPELSEEVCDKILDQFFKVVTWANDDDAGEFFEGFDTNELLVEYRRFLALKLANPDIVRAPKVLDEVWKAHMLCTQEYMDFCTIFNKGVQLQRDEPWADNKATVDAYRQSFGIRPDVRFWPAVVGLPEFSEEDKARIFEEWRAAGPLKFEDEEDECVEFLGGSCKWCDYWRRNVVFEEYRRFLALKLAWPDLVMRPPPLIDGAWHAHITCSQEYERFCQAYNKGKYLHHDPAVDDDKSTLSSLRVYKTMFSHVPPSSIWPDPNDVQT